MKESRTAVTGSRERSLGGLKALMCGGFFMEGGEYFSMSELIKW